MAGIRRWKEKLLLVWFTLFASVIWARPQSHAADGDKGVPSLSHESFWTFVECPQEGAEA